MVRRFHTRVASRSVLGKRRRYGLSRYRKRRRVTGRFRRTARTNTNRSSFGISSGGYRTRRTSSRQWRSILWRNTIASTHYRSIGTGVDYPLFTPNNTSQASFFRITPGATFWLAGSGAQPIDAGGTVPIFNGDIILRGGIVKLTLTNTPNADGLGSDPVRVNVFAIWTNKFYNSGYTLPTVVPLTWDPQVLPDFVTYGKVLYRKDFLLKGDGEVAEITHRMRVQKIDKAIFNAGGSRLEFFILLSQTSNTEAVAASESVSVQNSINFSFSSDATT